jgi:putative Holliday junction resolvase
MPENALHLLTLDPPTTYNGVLFGIDFGMRRIGIAVGQTFTGSANPLQTLLAQKGQPQQWQVLDKLIKEWQPLAFIIGIPLNMDDTAQPMTHHARRFAKQLQQRYHLPIHGMDERLTSFEVRQQLFDQGGYRAIQKNEIDALAATVILSEWMRLFSLNEH